MKKKFHCANCGCDRYKPCYCPRKGGKRPISVEDVEKALGLEGEKQTS